MRLFIFSAIMFIILSVGCSMPSGGGNGDGKNRGWYSNPDPYHQATISVKYKNGDPCKTAIAEWYSGTIRRTDNADSDGILHVSISAPDSAPFTIDILCTVYKDDSYNKIWEGNVSLVRVINPPYPNVSIVTSNPTYDHYRAVISMRYESNTPCTDSFADYYKSIYDNIPTRVHADSKGRLNMQYDKIFLIKNPDSEKRYCQVGKLNFHSTLWEGSIVFVKTDEWPDPILEIVVHDSLHN